MYTFYNVSDQLLENGVYHIRENGKIVRKLEKEDAVYVKTTRSLVGERKFYFYIIEYTHGDCIKIESFMDKEWTMLLDCVTSDINGMAFAINQMCVGLLKQNKPFPEELEKLLKDVIPLCISAMGSASFQKARYQYFEMYKWIVEKLGKSLVDYVNQAEIDEYAKAMIECYELPAVEMLLKEKEIKISDEVYLVYKKAKENMDKTIEIVKERIKNRYFSGVNYSGYGDFPTITIYVDNSPCGDVRVYINATSIEHNPEVEINMYIVYPDKYSTTQISMYEECKEYIGILKKEIYGDKI